MLCRGTFSPTYQLQHNHNKTRMEKPMKKIRNNNNQMNEVGILNLDGQVNNQ